jgi:hypothetical protein
MNFCFDHWELDDKSLEETYLKTSTVSTSKKVKYAKTCAVILIPSREEYYNAGINLWYDRKDLKLSQHQASIELKHFMEENPVLTMEAAMTYLYQPKIDIFYRNTDCWFASRNLNLLVIDKSTKSANDTVNDVINSQPKWQWSACVAHSGDVAIKMIKNGSQQFDIVLIDESIGRQETFNFCALVTIFRSIFGDSVFIGCTMTDQSDGLNTVNCTANASKKEALKAGCDFVWKRPISKFARMLPILLATRNKIPAETTTSPTSALSPAPPPRNRSSERSLASLDGLPDTDSNDNSDENEDDYEDNFANRVKNLIKFHENFELKEEFMPGSSVGLEIESILENVHIRNYKDLVSDDRLQGSCTFSNVPTQLDIDACDSNDSNSDANNDQDPSCFVDNKSDTSDGSGSTTGNDSVTSIDSSKQYRLLSK